MLVSNTGLGVFYGSLPNDRSLPNTKTSNESTSVDCTKTAFHAPNHGNDYSKDPEAA